nr:hypothetical protein [Rhizoctonia sp.]
MNFTTFFIWTEKKIVPGNIADLLTPLGLAYWICDDGCLYPEGSSGVRKDPSGQKTKRVILSTNSFTLKEVDLLLKILNDKFNLKCSVHQNNGSFVISISSKSLPVLQNLLASHMPSIMQYKI